MLNHATLTPAARAAGMVMGRPAAGSRARLRQRDRPGAAADWILEFGPEAEAYVKPLDGWIGARVRLGDMQLDFPTQADALAFARRHGWAVETGDPVQPAPSN